MAAGRRGPRLLLEEAAQREELSRGRAAPRRPALLFQRERSEIMSVLAALLRRGPLLQRRVQVRGAGWDSPREALAAGPRPEGAFSAGLGKTPAPCARVQKRRLLRSVSIRRGPVGV